jgi:hypothetical protein
MKGYYITYGIFTNKIEGIVNILENELDISLIKDGYIEDGEVYYLDKRTESKIKHFSISHGNPQGYHLNESEILYPDYLISCNVILSQNEDEYIKELRNILKNKKYIKELNLDIDEW